MIDPPTSNQPEWARCQANLNGLDGAWLAIDRSGVVQCANSSARSWLNGPSEAADQARVRALISHLAPGQDDLGLLPLAKTCLAGFVFPCQWNSDATLVNLRPTAQTEADSAAHLISRFSHVLRDPVSKLELFVNLLVEGRPERLSFYRATLMEETGRLTRLIENLGLLAQLMVAESVVLSPVSIDELVGDVQNSIRELPSVRGRLRVLTCLDHDLKIQANTRLLSNAIRHILTYLPHASMAAEPTVIRLQADQDWIGIALDSPAFAVFRESLPGLFEPFESGKMELEMVIVRQILYHHHGYVTASQRDVGCTLTLWVPAVHGSPTGEGGKPATQHQSGLRRADGEEVAATSVTTPGAATDSGLAQGRWWGG